MRIVDRALLFVRSAGVGIFATVADLASLGLLVHIARWSPLAASIPAFSLGALVQFVGNKLFAFHNRSRAWAIQGAAFAAVEAGAFVLNVVLYDFVVRSAPWPPLLVRLLTTQIVYVAFCLPLWSRVFRNREDAS